MSLLGRLEDLSLTDIVQIVFLSRRTGVLEIIDSHGRFTVLFRHGLIVNASSPESPTLADHLEATATIDHQTYTLVKQMEDVGVPAGTAVLDMNLISEQALADLIQQRVTSIVLPLLASREGEFNFILSDVVSEIDIEYDPEKIFREGGIQPQKVIGGEGEKLKPLRGLEESMKAGRALLRSATSPAPEPDPATFVDLGHTTSAAAGKEIVGEAPGEEVADDFPFGELTAETEAGDLAGAWADVSELMEPEAAIEEPGAGAPPEVSADAPDLAAATPQSSVPPGPPPSSASLSRFKIDSAETDATLSADFRNVVIYERNPMIRVAAKRAFGRRSVHVFQFGSIEDTRSAISDLLKENKQFVTFLELDAEHDVSPVLETLKILKQRNALLPVVVVDGEADLRRRHRLLQLGADLYLTKPSEAHMQPGLVEEQLAMFADELVVFAERSFHEWQRQTGSGTSSGGQEQFFQLAEKDRLNRSFGLLKQLINQLSNPNDISQVSLTVLRLGAEYVDRGVLFFVSESDFVGLGGFGSTGDGLEMNSRVRKLRIPREESSVLSEVTSTRAVHRGKMKRTAANEMLISRMGMITPTEVVAFPILDRDRVVGVFFGDNATRKAPIENTVGLEIFLQQAGFAFHNALIASAKRYDWMQEGR